MSSRIWGKYIFVSVYHCTNKTSGDMKNMRSGSKDDQNVDITGRFCDCDASF